MTTELTLLLNSPVLRQFMLHCFCYTQGAVGHPSIMPLNPKQDRNLETQCIINYSIF